jgi:BioD-like phosphotransacetylase family protein
MATLYVLSTEPNAGKTAVCAALGLEYRDAGLTVGYFKPLGTNQVEESGRMVDQDCLFAHRLLGPGNSLDESCPQIMTPDVEGRPFPTPGPSRLEEVRELHRQIGSTCDLVITEGPPRLSDGFFSGIPPATLAEAMDAKAIIVSRYQPGLSIDRILMAQAIIGDRLRGVVVNSVPQDAMSAVREDFEPYLRSRALTLFGAMARDELLSAVRVGDLVTELGGRLLCGEEKLDDLVEGFGIGAMSVDSALKRLLRSTNLAVITGGDRADIQIAALFASVKCLILTGNLYPDNAVLTRASETGTPVILVSTDTKTTVEATDRLLGRIHLSSSRQIERLRELVRRDVDLAGLRREVMGA